MIHFYKLYSYIASSCSKLLKETDEAVTRLSDPDSEELITFNEQQPFLLVLQTRQQSKWLEQYGNTITCMDATYKTLRYGFPCFFLIVKTSLGIGRVVGTIIPQYETEELITAGLQKLSDWNPPWSPRFFMTDKSTQELGKVTACVYKLNRNIHLGAVKAVHPNCVRLICDFHTLQAFERWVNCSHHNVPLEAKNTVKQTFKKLIYSKTGEQIYISGL